MDEQVNEPVHAPAEGAPMEGGLPTEVVAEGEVVVEEVSAEAESTDEQSANVTE